MDDGTGSQEEVYKRRVSSRRTEGKSGDTDRGVDAADLETIFYRDWEPVKRAEGGSGPGEVSI